LLESNQFLNSPSQRKEPIRRDREQHRKEVNHDE